MGAQSPRWAIAGCCLAVLLGAVTGCGDGSGLALNRLMEARRLAAELLVQFSRAADAANRAVMADTDDASAAFASEAGKATQAVQRHTGELKPLLLALGYSAEARVLDEFSGRFAKYHELDRIILGLAVENTNLKAQRLSFGPVRQEADAFRDALDSVVRSSPAKDAWQITALVATAVSAVREVQVLQAPHIAEADDAAMTRFEEQMRLSEGRARGALEALATVIPAASQPALAAATAALDRFRDLNAQVVVLSRRNSNVRSLALSLGEKRMLTAECEERLHALQAALLTRGFTGTR